MAWTSRFTLDPDEDQQILQKWFHECAADVTRPAVAECR